MSRSGDEMIGELSKILGGGLEKTASVEEPVGPSEEENELLLLPSTLFRDFRRLQLN
jgi:hypothetical protein